jgi:hypothetical protein
MWAAYRHKLGARVPDSIGVDAEFTVHSLSISGWLFFTAISLCFVWTFRESPKRARLACQFFLCVAIAAVWLFVSRTIGDIVNVEYFGHMLFGMGALALARLGQKHIVFNRRNSTGR